MSKGLVNRLIQYLTKNSLPTEITSSRDASASKNTDIQSLQEKSHFPQNEEHKLENTFFVFVLEISERSSRWSTSSTFRHQGVKHEDKGKDKDTAAPCTLLMLFECWVSLKHPLALYLWYSP